jgi:hypothetical protein
MPVDTGRGVRPAAGGAALLSARKAFTTRRVWSTRACRLPWGEGCRYIARTRSSPTDMPSSISAAWPGSREQPAAAPVPYARVAQPTPVQGSALGASGTVRARVEAPLAFQVGGRIVARRVDAGQSVRAGQTLMSLDPRDLDQAVRGGRRRRSAGPHAACDLHGIVPRTVHMRLAISSSITSVAPPPMASTRASRTMRSMADSRM